jgi:hypothetical protein
MLARLTTPGADVALSLRHAVLRFAAARGWLVVGGWAQELGLREQLPPQSRSYYDERFACRMSDVDAICADPVGDLVELAVKLHRETGIRMTASVGMSPNVYHLQAEGFGSLVDLQAVTPELLAAMPASGPYPLSLSLNTTSPDGHGHGHAEIRLRTSRLATELATQYCIVDNVLNWYHSVPTASYEKLASRIRAMEAVVPAALSSRPLYEQQQLNSTQTQQPAMAIPSDVCGMCAVVREMPGDVLVCATDAARVIRSLLPPHMPACRLYAPFDVSPKYLAIVEIGGGGVTVFVTAEPVPCASDGRQSGKIAGGPKPCLVVSPRTAAGHLRATDIWRRRLGDAAGAAVRASAFAASLAALLPFDVGADPPATTYAGTLPIEPVMARYMRTKGTGPMPFRYATPAAGPIDPAQVAGIVRGIRGAAAHLRGAVPEVRDGRFLFEATFSSDAAVAASEIDRALARASPPNLFSMDLHRRLPQQQQNNNRNNNRNNNNNKKWRKMRPS